MRVRLRLTAAASVPPSDEETTGDPRPHPTIAVPSGDYIVEDKATAHNLATAFGDNNYTAEVLPLLDHAADLPQIQHHFTAAVFQDFIRHGRRINCSTRNSIPYPVPPSERKQPPATTPVAPPPGFNELTDALGDLAHPSEVMGVVDTSSTPPYLSIVPVHRTSRELQSGDTMNSKDATLRQSITAKKRKMKRALLNLPAPPYPASAELQPRSSNGKRMARSKANVDNANFMSAAHRRLFSDFKSTDEANIMDTAHRLSTVDIISYVQSFEYLLLRERQGRSNSMSLSTECFTSMQPEIIKFWNLRGGKFIHLPVIVGRGRTSHLVGVSVAPKQRRIFVYDPRKLYGSKAMKMEDTIESLNNNSFRNEELHFSNGEVLRGAVAKAIQHIFNEASKLDSNCNPNSYGIVWRIHMVNSFMYQENDVDCGAFVCFFFDCLSRDVKLNAGRNQDRGVKMDIYREWIAFSCCVNRMHSSIKKKDNRPRGDEEKRDVIELSDESD